MTRTQDLPGRVLRFVRKNDLVTKGDHLVVGVSGGPDSVCLLLILAELRKSLGITLHVAHLNHMLRGAESDGDAEYISLLARELDVPVTIEQRDVEAYRKRHRLSLEEAAREVRYKFFSDVVRSPGPGVVAVGHTADDHIETVLMHLVRGTGLTGLRGMLPLNTLTMPDGFRLRIARPLLELRRDETNSYCTARGFSPRSDSSNQAYNRFRNRIRSELIPLLREYNPDIEEALRRLSSTSVADMAYIEEETLRLWGPVAKERPEGIAIDKREFSRLHLALQRHLIRSALQRILGDIHDIESVHVESLLEALGKPAGKRLSLPRNLDFYGDYNHGLITSGSPPVTCPFPELNGEHRLNVPGDTTVCGRRVRSSVLGNVPVEENREKLKTYLDLDIAGDKLTIRARRKGDRFQPLGMDSTKKLQDFMVDEKIPQLWRDRVPLVCSPQQILWVVGWRIDHRARVTPSTRRVLCLEFETN